MQHELGTNPTADLEGAKPVRGLKADDAELAAKASELSRHLIKVERGKDEFWAQSMRDLTAALLVWDAMQGRDRPGIAGDVG
jgi:hypothetical protein